MTPQATITTQQVGRLVAKRSAQQMRLSHACSGTHSRAIGRNAKNPIGRAKHVHYPHARAVLRHAA